MKYIIESPALLGDDISEMDQELRDRLIGWYAEIQAVAQEINDRVSLTRATSRIAELREMQP